MTWEERWHPLREEWIIIAAHRQHRPWKGEIIEHEETPMPAFVSDCYLCPGNTRVSGKRNAQYTGTYVFDNDHPCVGLDAPPAVAAANGLYRSQPACGISRVVCYSPRHNLTLAELEVCEIENLLRAWQQQYVDLGSRKGINHVLIFENKGEAVGVSNPHPHCQIYATNFIFKTIETEARVSKRHLAETGRVLFRDVLKAEHQDGRRIICENDSAIAFLPYFARYAYEVYVAPRETHASLATLSQKEVCDFSRTLKCLLVKFDNLWQIPFPYVMTLHQSPTDGDAYDGFHFHIEIHPPLRQPNLLKYLAGPEIGGGNFLSDTSPEEKAAELIAQADVHYKVSAKSLVTTK
jgi:UDPglucose--hexose-1-phosphate uridylyltransferase